MNHIKMKWKFKKGKRKSRASLSTPQHGTRVAPRPNKYPFRSDSALIDKGREFKWMSLADEHLELLGNRYQANRICFLLDITFEAYLKAPKGWDRIAKHMANGGGCRVEGGELVVNHA